MGRCRRRWNPPGPPRPAWLSYTMTSEKLNAEKTLSVIPCSFHPVSLPLTCVRESVCVWRLFVSGLWGFRVGFPFKIHQEVSSLSRWSSSTRTRELTFRECQSSPFQKLFSAPQQHLSQSPYCLADYPRGQTSLLPPPTKASSQKSLEALLVGPSLPP